MNILQKKIIILLPYSNMLGHPMSIEEEAKLDAMQRQWQHGRYGTSSLAFFEEITETEDLLTLSVQVSQVIINICHSSSRFKFMRVSCLYYFHKKYIFFTLNILKGDGPKSP